MTVSAFESLPSRCVEAYLASLQGFSIVGAPAKRGGEVPLETAQDRLCGAKTVAQLSRSAEHRPLNARHGPDHAGLCGQPARQGERVSAKAPEKGSTRSHRQLPRHAGIVLGICRDSLGFETASR